MTISLDDVISAFDLESLALTWRKRGSIKLQVRQLSTGGQLATYSVDFKPSLKEAVLALGDQLLQTASGERAEKIAAVLTALRADG